MSTSTFEKKKHPTIAMKAIESSQIKQYGYDPASQTLAIQFAKGGVYHYSAFTPKHWEAFQKAKSAGSFFHKNVRGKFKHNLISE